MAVREASVDTLVMARQKPWTQTPFVQEVPRLLGERGMSLRALATAADVDPGHLSRVLRGASYKTPSGDLARRVAVALALPKDYFPEYREAIVLERVRHDPEIRDRLYRRMA
jgi:transcriptional regulator with XRE-family HTH domain